jgi:hypothetical protein
MEASHRDLRRILFALILIIAGMGAASVIGLWALNTSADRRAAEDYLALCTTLQRQAGLAAARSIVVAERDRAIARVLRDAPIPPDVRRLAVVFDRVAHFDARYAMLQRQFATARCDRITPPPPRSAEGASREGG